jgi:hypothetical protein
MPKRKNRIASTVKQFHEDERSGTMNLSNYVTTARAAELLGVDPSQVARLRDEDIQGFKPGHDWLVFVPSVSKYLQNKSKRGRPSSGTPRLQEAA